jgi:hypothetical protein
MRLKNRLSPELEKKEEFPGHTQSMPPENSFPQICVVSVTEFVEICHFQQEYGRTIALSNLLYLLKNNHGDCSTAHMGVLHQFPKS